MACWSPESSLSYGEMGKMIRWCRCVTWWSTFGGGRVVRVPKEGYDEPHTRKCPRT